MIVLDMDGTILNHHNQVTDQTRETIKKLRDKGFLVCIATGRSYNEINQVAPDIEVDGIISANGMDVYIAEDKIKENSLDLSLVKRIVEMARDDQVYYEVHPNDGPCVSFIRDRAFMEQEIEEPKPDSVGINEWLSRKAAIAKDIHWVEELPDKSYAKFYFFARTEEKINRWMTRLDQLKKEVDFTTSSSTNHNVELMVANVNKATGIEHLLDHFQLEPEDILAIGDSDNDIPMLKFVGYPVVMKNGTDTIKALAKEVTEKTCDQDGVSDYLTRKYQI
nr:HAD family hydrolase [Aquibacillus salsiterrae]